MCLNFGGYERRNEIHSIYKTDRESRKDPYDLDKINLGSIKTKKNTEKGAFVEMKKQGQRNFKKMYEATVGDAYKNIQRENDRADYIKNLLSQAAE